MFFPEITKLSNSLLDDPDDMVQKGIGLASARDGEIRPEADRALFNEDSRPRSATSAKNCVRDANPHR